MLVEGGLLHGGVGTLATFKTHRGFRGVASHNVRLQLELGDAPVVALWAVPLFLEVDAVHPLLVHVGHVFHKPHADGRRKITEYALKNTYSHFGI